MNAKNWGCAKKPYFSIEAHACQSRSLIDQICLGVHDDPTFFMAIHSKNNFILDQKQSPRQEGEGLQTQ